MTLKRKFADEIGFESVYALLSKHPPSLIANAIEQHGVYTWDGVGRYIQARDDANTGWVYRFDENRQASLLQHLGVEYPPDRRTQSRVIALLEYFNTYWEKAEESGLPLEIENTVTIKVPAKQVYTLPLDTIDSQEPANTQAITVPLELSAELAKFGWARDDKPDFSAIQPGAITQTTGKDEQIQSSAETDYSNGRRETDPFAVFREMDNLKGEDLEVEFAPNQMLVISINSVTKRAAYSDLKLMDNRNGELNKLGALLLGIALGETIPQSAEKTVSKLRKIFRESLGIKPDPFHPKKHNYTPRFKVYDGRNRADERARDDALRAQSNGGPIIDPGDPDRGKEDAAAEWLKENSRKIN